MNVMLSPDRSTPSLRFADRDTPFVRNCWYVAGWSDEVGRALTHRWLLDQDILLYRTLAGEVAALQNRCAHRSFPLDQGKLDGDTVVCLYHGLAFGPDGGCRHAPSDDREVVRRSARIQRYPAVERDTLVWVWMGDPDRADPLLIPPTPWLAQDGWAHGRGYARIEANYLALHENLLDTTHFSFLHAGNVGTPGYAMAPYELELGERTARISRTQANDVLPALYDRPMGIVGEAINRHTDSWFLTPGWHVAHAAVERIGAGPGERRDYRTEILHGITPAEPGVTHYWWAIARDYAADDAAVTRYMEEAIVEAFDEDRLALEAIEALTQREHRPGFREISVAPDRAGLHMRKVIAKLAREELETAA